MVKTISNEYNLLLSQLNRWETIIGQKPAINEIIELTQLDNLIERMIHKRVVRDEEEIRHYAVNPTSILRKAIFTLLLVLYL